MGQGYEDYIEKDQQACLAPLLSFNNAIVITHNSSQLTPQAHGAQTA